MVKEEKLTPEMWQFYNIIKNCGEIGIRITGLSVALDEKEEDQLEVFHSKHLGTTKLYRRYYNLKEAINNSSEVDKIIIIDKGYMFRLATEKEAMEYYKKLYDRGIDYLNRASFIKKKINLDNQGKLLNNQYNELTPENKQFHETYAKGDLYD